MVDIKKAKLALDEVRSLYQKHDADSNHIDGKAGNFLSSSSLILSLFGVLQIALVKDEQHLLYKILVVLLFLLFLIMIFLVLKILTPKGYKTVFEENWEGIENAILVKENESKATLQLISNYLERIQHNKEINRNKAIQLKNVTWLFSAQMAIVVGISLFTFR